MDSDKIIIRNLNLETYTDEYALHDVNLTIDRGNIFGLLGREASGKAQVLKILAMNEKPDSGQIKILGLDYETEKSEIAGRTAFCSLDSALYDTLTFYENLDIHARQYNVPEERKNKCLEMITRLAKDIDLTKVKTAKLGPSLKRIINLWFAILKNKELLLVEEPTLQVEEEAKPLVRQLLMDYQAAGKTIIFSTEDIDEAEALAGNNFAIIDRGMIVTE